MALIRPVVLVFQEFASPTVTPATPDLNCLIVGPAYHIQDYFTPGSTAYADKTSIKTAADYGTLEPNIGSETPSVLAVAEPPNNAVGAVLDATSVKVYFDQARVVITSGTTNGTTSAATPSTFTITDPGDLVDFTGVAGSVVGATKVVPGDRVILTDSSHTIARTVYAVDDKHTLRFTQDIPATDWTPGSSHSWRIERQMNDALVDSSFVTVTGNALSVAANVTLNVATQGAKNVTYAQVYIGYRALRQDLTELNTIASTADIVGTLGRIDARNPLAVGVFVARQNTTSRVQYVGVTTNDLTGHSAVRDAIAPRPDVYAIVPLTADPSVLAMWNTDCVGLALPDEVRGRPQKFRVVIGSGTLPITKDIIECLPANPNTEPAFPGRAITGKAEGSTGTAPTAIVKLTFTDTPAVDLLTANVVPGDTLVISADAAGTSRDGTYTVASVTSATELEINVPTTAITAASAAASIYIHGGDPNTDKVGTSVTPLALTDLTSAQGDDLYLLLRDDSGTFITSGVAAGDLLQLPVDPNETALDGTLVSLVVASVLSENRLLIVNNGADTSLVQNELPHGVARTGGALAPTTAILRYQIVRTLSKDGQVSQLIAQAQSFNSRRTVLVWPDRVDVSGVVGGTTQPGYYLSCAVGGMTAGLPPHQGFTFLGISGISRIYDSNTYFKDDQLTDLSNGGWYVFAQQTPSSLPYTIHQLTTDPSTLESGEFSVVKNFDFISMYFVDILNDFLGVYNVNNDTLVLIRAALSIGGESLKLRTYSKIGAPLTYFSILDLGVSSVSGDRVVTRLGVGLPKPLNVVELHLVA